MNDVNVVVLAGEVASDPIGRTLPDGGAVTELRLSVKAEGRRVLPLPVVVGNAVEVEGAAGFGGYSGSWDGERVTPGLIVKGSRVLVTGELVRRFYRSGAGARSLTEVVASGVKLLGTADEDAA